MIVSREGPRKTFAGMFWSCFLSRERLKAGLRFGIGTERIKQSSRVSMARYVPQLTEVIALHPRAPKQNLTAVDDLGAQHRSGH